MTTDSQFEELSRLQNQQDLSEGNTVYANESTGAMDMVKRDRFELLSAYLDGEVTAAERRQVEEWLVGDPTVQHLYARLLKLRQGVRTLSVPSGQHSVEDTVEQVMARLRRRAKLVWLGGGAAIAACIIGTVSSALTGGESSMPQLAQQAIPQTQSTIPAHVIASPLMVAINDPVIPIPKTAESSPESLLNKVQLPSDLEFDIN